MTSRKKRPDLHVKPDRNPWTENDVILGRIWRHYRGGMYTTIGIARESTNGPEEGRTRVVYTNTGGELCVRDADEFLDGRFAPVLTLEIAEPLR